MGVDPNLDEVIVIADPNFDTGIGWSRSGGVWTFIGGKAHFLSLGSGGSLYQVTNFLIDFSYIATFTLSNCNFTAGPTIGIQVVIGGASAGIFNTNGTHSVFITPSGSSGAITFLDANTVAGDSCDLDTIQIENLSNYTQENLEILIREPKYVNVHEAVATDFYQSISCKKDNSSCLISFDT